MNIKLNITDNTENKDAVTALQEVIKQLEEGNTYGC